jgi:peptidyl-prolyl cis-trans isomerase C
MSGCNQGVLLAVVLAVSASSASALQTAKSSGKAKPAVAATSETVLVRVNGQKITQADLDRRLTFWQVPPDERDKYRKPFLEDLIEARLILQFLASRKTAATKQEIDAEIKRIRESAKKPGADPDKALAELGLPTEALREELALRLAWKHHIDRAIPPARLKAYFEEHRDEFDETEVRSRQILIKVPTGDEDAWKAAEAKMASLRKQIVDGRISFEDAAREHSQAPSKEQGGDVGWFKFTGKMPEQIARQVFRLKVGEMSLPFRTRFGVHLCIATDRKPGDLSLEDVRDEVIGRMAQELWKEQVAELRQKAKIEWKSEKP